LTAFAVCKPSRNILVTLVYKAFTEEKTTFPKKILPFILGKVIPVKILEISIKVFFSL